jgi:hypothetical protein
MMKTAIKTIFTLLLFAFCSTSQAQYIGIVVDFMKVKPGNMGKYLEVEKEWKKIHQARVDQGMIIQWHLWQKMYSGADDPYQYITVAFFDDFNKTENSIPWDWIEENYSQEERNDLMKRTGQSRTMVRTEVYHQVAAALGKETSRYILVNRMKVKPGQGGVYRTLEQDIIQPIMAEAINRGNRHSWIAWEKWPGDSDFQFVTVDGYAEYGQWQDGWIGEEILKAVHPDLSSDELGEKIGNARTMKSTELWKLVDAVGPAVGSMQ